MVRDNKIAIVEIFKSIDGEAFHSGQATVFVRTFGCNLRCGFCDSAYTLSEPEFKKAYNKDLRWMTAKEIFEEVDKLEIDFKYKSICLTGGEPLMESNKDFMLNELIPLFVKRKYAVNIETNGAIDYIPYKKKFGEPKILDAYGNRRGVTLITDWKLPFSKMNNLMIKSNLKILSKNDIIKFVISDDKQDWAELKTILEIYKPKAKIYLSPVFGEVTMSKIPEFICKHPEYNICAQIQVHKIFWAPDAIGV